MKKIYIYCLVVLLNIFYGCENEFDYKFNQGQNNYVLKAKIEQSDLSRTLLNGNRVEWAEGDVIGVYGDKGSINVSFEHKQLDDFVGCLEEDEYPLWSYYPYDSMAVFDKSTLTFTLPSTFDYTSNSNAPMIGVKQKDDLFVFRHLCGLLKFSVDSIPVDSTFLVISSEGNPAPAIAGKVMVDDVLAQNAILVANDSIKDITINMNRNVGSRTFYIPLPVGKYPLLKVALFAKDSTLLFSNSISDVEIKRAVMLNICKNEGSEVIISPIENIKNVIQRNKNKKKDELLNILVRVLENYIDDDVICVYPPIDSSFKDGLIEIEEKGKNNPQKIGVYIEPENASVDGQFEIPNTPRNHWVSKVKSFESGKLNNSGKDSYDDILDNTNILCWVPFYKEIPHISVDDELVKDSPLDLKRNVYDNEKATYANLVGNLSANGIVSITTHGSEGKYIFVPDKEALGKKGFEIYWLYCEGDRYVDAKIMYPLMAEHFYGYNFYENAIVYNTSCFSYSNKTSTNDKLLNNQFSTMGISTYAGYSNVVYPGNDKALASEYYYNLFHELKSNKQSVPKDCFYSMGSSIIGTLKFDFWREVKFIDFRPKGSVLIDEENVTLPFEFKGVGNLKEDCYIGLLIGDNERFDSLKCENYHMVKYSIDHFNEDNSLFNVKIPLQQYKGFLVEKGLSVEDKMFYRVFLEYNNRRWISDECCEFSIDSNDEVVGKAVDLGLSVLWASHNVGATRPEEYGGYYAWGETEEKEKYTDENYKYYDRMTGEMADLGREISGTKYDVAKMKWGDNWHMPTADEMLELTEQCEWTDTIYNGIKGKRVKGRNGNSIFLPAAGVGMPASETFVPGECGVYYLGTLEETDMEGIDMEKIHLLASKLYFDTDTIGYCIGFIITSTGREIGLPVRPVKNR